MSKDNEVRRSTRTQHRSNRWFDTQRAHIRGMRATPNPSLKRNRSGKPALAVISFLAKAVLPPRAA